MRLQCASSLKTYTAMKPGLPREQRWKESSWQTKFMRTMAVCIPYSIKSENTVILEELWAPSITWIMMMMIGDEKAVFKGRRVRQETGKTRVECDRDRTGTGEKPEELANSSYVQKYTAGNGDITPNILGPFKRFSWWLFVSVRPCTSVFPSRMPKIDARICACFPRHLQTPFS